MLAFERHGQGEPLVLVHGVAHRRQAWYPVLDQLAEQRDVVLVDLPGHGESAALITDGRPMADVLTTEFRRFLADLELDRPHVAGNSLGGRIALEAAAAGDVRSATAFSPAGFWRHPVEFGYTRTLFNTMSALSGRLGPSGQPLTRSGLGRALVYGVIAAHPSRISPDQALGDLRAFERARPALAEILDAAVPFEQAIAPDVPVTIAWAGRDLVFPPWQARLAGRQLPTATHLIMPGVGHVPMADDPERVAEIILQGSAPVPSFSAAGPATPAGRVRRSDAAASA